MILKDINFKQERDFGDLFNATFSFLGQEFKKLGTAVLYFVVPFLLLAAIAMTFYSVKAQEMQQTILADPKNPFAVFSVMGALFGYVGVAILLSMIASTMLFGTVYGYIKLYVEKGSGGFTLADVWAQATKNFFRLFLGLVVTGIVFVIGFILCIIPGIYIGVALSIVFCIMIFEEMSYFDSFSRSMKLINKNWWFTFGVLIVMIIMLYILQVLISLPAMLFGLKSIFTNITHIKTGQNPIPSLSLSFYIVNALTNLVTQLLSVIPIVLSAFLYFSTVEKIEKPSLIDRIDQIGADA